LAGGLQATPDAVFDMLAGLVVHKDHTSEAATFKTMARRVGGTAGAAQAMALAGRQDVTAQLASLKMPTLVLWGSDDALVPVAVGKKMADALPNSQFEVLPDCGHLPTLEKPAGSAALFAQLLQKIA